VSVVMDKVAMSRDIQSGVESVLGGHMTSDSRARDVFEEGVMV